MQKIIRKKQLLELIGLRRTALSDAIKAGRFPAPIKIGPRAVGWLAEEIAAWQQNKIADRDRARAAGRAE